MIDISLLMPYRNRPNHMNAVLRWFDKSRELTQGSIELVIVESSPRPTLMTAQINHPNIKYKHVEENGPFNKSSLLNIALEMSEGMYLTSFDVDLVPYDLTFSLHLKLARQSSMMLISGYRIDTDVEDFEPSQLSYLQSRSKIAKEDLHEGFLEDQLLHKHRFGVLPFFERNIVNSIGGWDESFIGWGGEDQDIIHRYLGTERFLLKSPDLVYLHLKHGHVPDWNNGDLTRKNRALLYDKLKLNPNII